MRLRFSSNIYVLKIKIKTVHSTFLCTIALKKCEIFFNYILNKEVYFIFNKVV